MSMTLSSPFVHKFDVISTQEFISYVAENIARPHYQDQPGECSVAK